MENPLLIAVLEYIWGYYDPDKSFLGRPAGFYQQLLVSKLCLDALPLWI